MSGWMGAQLHQFHSNNDFSQLHCDFESCTRSPSSLSPSLSSDYYSHDNPVDTNLPEDTGMDIDPDHETAARRKFTDTYEGCSKAFIGGTTFMDSFWQDKYAEERRENLYFPFTSSNEWEFASWCSRSGLSITAIDSLLSLNTVSQYEFLSTDTKTVFKIKKLSFSFRTAKDLRSRVETLPAGSKWLCERMEPKYPAKKPVHLFYRHPLDCLQALMSNPILTPHISFVPRRVWTSAAQICCIYEDWLSGDCAWDMQVSR